MARPKKEIDEQQVKSLAAINCSYEEMADILGCDQRTLSRRFAQAIREGRSSGNMSLKRKAWDMAMSGNTSMAIFLLKNQCEYRDQPKEEKKEPTINMTEEYVSGWAKSNEPGEKIP